MLHNDSVDKIVERYFAAVTRVPFVYKGKEYLPKPLKVSPLLLRDYTCPVGCGGCCFKFTLDYLPDDPRPTALERRMVEFNGRPIAIYTDTQTDNDGPRCKHLTREGRCGIHGKHPFSCDFELIRTLAFEDADRPNVLTQKLFGRGWSYQRADGGKGALCEMLDVTPKSIMEVVRKLERLKKWTDHFKLKDTWLPEIIRLINNGTLSRGGSVDLRIPKSKGLIF